MINISIPCFHHGCNNNDHKVKFDVEELLKDKVFCGVMDCSHIATSTICEGYSLYRVCTVHAQGKVLYHKEVYGQ